jgi:putative ABC transport system permease protein
VRLMPGLNRAVGFAAGGTLALALLVCGCVFAAMAGPAISLHTRSEALHQTLAGLAPTTKAVQVSANWSDFVSSLNLTANSSEPNLSASMFTEAAREVKASVAATPLPLGPGAWAGLSTNTFDVASGAPPRAFIGSTPPKLEVLYRDPLLSNAALVAGSLTGPAEPNGTIAVAATPQTAARFALHPGSRLTLGTAGVAVTLGTAGVAVTLVVTAIVRPEGSGSTFWQQDPVAGVPSMAAPPKASPYWVGGLLADPDQLAEIQNAFLGPGLEMEWEFPLAVGGLSADQAQGLYDALNRAVRVTPTLTSMQAAADNLVVASPLAAQLSGFLGTQAGIETVLLLLYVSLIVIGAAVILLAARIIVLRRDGELAMLRARGGSLQQVAAVTGRGALIAALPAAVIGAGLAIAVVPGGTASSALGWSLAVVAVAVALAGPPLIAAWRYRKPAPVVNPALITTADTSRRRRIAWRRPVAEVTACAAAIAGLVVLHNQGQPAGGQINLFVTAAPVLVAIPVVVIMLRLYPLAVRGLFALSARGTGATGFVAMSRATRSSLTGVLPAFALVLALCLATFAGMVSDGIVRGETAASWDTTGADALIQPGPASAPITPAVVQAIERVRGVRHATAVWNDVLVTPFGQPVTVAAVDPAGYAALVATTPFPSVPVAKIGAVSPSAASEPVLASPAAAAVLGRGTAQLTALGPVGQVTVRVAGILDSTPAQPGGGAFVVMAQQALSGQPAPNMILVAGSSIDHSQLSAVVNRLTADSIITYRASVLASLSSSPLQHGAALIVVLTIVEAAVLGLFIVLLGLALGSADRELTLARLTVMGHERDTRLVMAETMPAVITAVVAGAVCAVVLPHLIGPSIDLSAFTGTSVPVQFQPDVIALGLPAAAVVVLAVAALAAEARSLRRRGVTGMLRVE